MTRTLAAVLAIAAATVASAPTAAQSQSQYYARERLVGVPTFTYEATYSTTYSTCSGGVQSAPIVSCRRSDGQTVPNAQCGPAKQTTTRGCVSGIVCSPLSSLYGQTSGGTPLELGRGVTRAEAQTLCQSYATDGKQAGVCSYTSGDGAAVFRIGGIRSGQSGGVYTAVCKQE